MNLPIHGILVPAYIARDAVRIEVLSDYFGDMYAVPMAIDRDLKVALLQVPLNNVHSFNGAGHSS